MNSIQRNRKLRLHSRIYGRRGIRDHFSRTHGFIASLQRQMMDDERTEYLDLQHLRENAVARVPVQRIV